MTPEPGSGTGDGIVPVGLGARAYDIHVGRGLLEETGRLISSLAPGTRCAIVTDETVAGLHLGRLEDGLRDQVGIAGTVILPPGEASKSFARLQPLCERLLESGIERADTVIAFGGGVIGDLAGFAASIVRRGIRLVQIPTTLLAQVDSSVGGKTGINTPQGKNLVGTFHQPALVVADLEVLNTLPPREFAAGYAECVKYGFLGDAEFFEWLDRNWPGVFEGGGPMRARAVAASCRAKAAVVAEDEREHGRRALLNLGHTFGHALEAFAGYSGKLLHGEAVAIGMALAFEFSEELNFCGAEARRRAVSHLEKVGLPTRIRDIPGNEWPTPEVLLRHIAQDKKMMAGKPVFILVRDIGDAFIEPDVAMADLENFLTRKCSGE